jgi:hypothetical protein
MEYQKEVKLTNKTNEDILENIKTEIGYYRDLKPDSFPRFVSNQSSLLNLVDLYYISQYRDGDTDNLGQKKAFYNINSLPVDVAAKELDIDTKNIRIFAEDWASSYGCMLMKMELEQWMKLKYFGRELNKYSHLLSKYGHLILKKVGNEIRIVPIQNIVFRPDAYSLNDTPLVEVHFYNSVDDFRAEAKSMSWDNYQTVISQYENDRRHKSKFIVYEAWFPPKMIAGHNYFVISSYGDVLASMRMEDNLYKGLPFEELPGRLLGRGQVEKLFEEQIYLNRIANYKAEGLHWSSKNIFHTRDSKVSSNLLSDIDNGEILTSLDGINRVDMREQNLGVYSYEEQRYEGNAYRRTFSSNPVTGESSPAGVPFRALFMQQQQAGGFYKRKREDLGMFLKEVITDWVIPEFKKENRKEHKVMIESIMSDDEKSERFFEGLVDLKFAERWKARGGFNPREAEAMRALLREKLLRGNITISKDTYDKIKYNIKIDITGEAIDSNYKAQAYQMMAQVTAQNPTIWHDPVTSRIFRKMFEAMGISTIDIPVARKTIEDVIGEQRAQVGGSVAAPVSGEPTMMPETATI